jgi:hypothetical protein
MESIQSQTPARKEVNFAELDKIDKNFRENYRGILPEIEKILFDKLQISPTEYRITGVTFEPRNPPGCLPYVRYERGVGFVVGISCAPD